MVRTILSTIICILVSACGTLGPATIPNDQVDYADAMSRGEARLALLNIVKLRYQDVVTFVEANQVVAGYQLQGQINLSGQLGRADSGGTLGAQGTFSNSPTITYSPVTGGDFETLLLTPIPPLDLFALANSGVSTSVVLSVGLQQFNGVSNPGVGLATDESETNSSIRELMHQGEVLRQAGRLSVDVETTGKGKDVKRALFYNFLQGKPDPELDRQERPLARDPRPRPEGQAFSGRIWHRAGWAGRDPSCDPLDHGDFDRCGAGHSGAGERYCRRPHHGDAGRLPSRRAHHYPIKHRVAVSK